MKKKRIPAALQCLASLGILLAAVYFAAFLTPPATRFNALYLLLWIITIAYIGFLLMLLLRQNQQLTKALKAQQTAEGILGEAEAGIIRFTMGDDLTLQYANEGMCRLCGYTVEELMGKSHCFCMVAEDRERYGTEMAAQLQQYGHYHVEYSMEAKDAHLLRILEYGHIQCVRPQGDCVQSTLLEVSHYHDVETSLHALNQQMKFNELRYEAALPYADVFMFDYLPDTKQIIYYRSLCAYFGAGMEAMLDDSLDSLLDCGIIHRNFHEDVRRLFQRIDEGAAQSETSVIITNSKGEERINQMVLISTDAACFSTRRAIGIIKDVTVQNMLERERNLNTAITAESMLNFVVDMNQDVILSANDAFTRLTATSVGAVYSVAYLDIIRTCIHPDDALNYLDFFNPDNLWESFENNISHKRINYRFLGENMQFIWVECAVNMVRDSISDHLCAFFQIWDVDEEKKREHKAQMEQKYYAAMLDGTEHAYEINFTEDVFISGTEDWETHFGIQALESYSETLELMEQKVVFAEDVPIHHATMSKDSILSAFTLGKTEIHCEVRFSSVDTQEYRWHEITLHLFRDIETNHVKGFGYVRDIHDRKKREEDLVYQSQHDGLTGLFNKRATEHLIDERISALENEDMYALFILDLDNFKAINDTFGHAYGDMVLVDTSNHLRRNFRSQDIVGRIGGDEFLVFAGQLPNKEVAFHHANALLEACSTDYVKDGVTVSVSISVGIAFFPQDGNGFRQLYQNADAALYQSKEKGKACYTCYDQSEVQSSVR